MQFMIMEHERLIEKHAKRLGLPDLKVSYSALADGGALSEATISGAAHVVVGGVGALVTLWARTKGQLDVKGIAALGATPLFLNTRNPDVSGVKDLTEKDRIALPGAKISPQATTLQLAAAQAFGETEWERLDKWTVTMSHPSGYQAMVGGGTEITGHFTSPPYQYQELEKPGIRRVLSTYDVWGGRLTIFVAWATSKFRDANPKTFAAVFAAIEEATAFVNADKRAAAEIYLKVAKEKITADEIVKFLSDPDVEYALAPRRLEKFAQFKHKIGAIKARPDSWKDLFFPEVHALPGD